MESFIFGKSALGLPVTGVNLLSPGEDRPHVLVIGGVHGDEIEGVILAKALEGDLRTAPNTPVNLTIVPQFNLDGILLKTRQNYRGVDLNRNLPTKDWDSSFTKIRYYPGQSPQSEPENQSLVEFLASQKIDLIISLHSWKPMLNPNGDCIKIAEFLSEKTGYIVQPDMGYPTPGSLGTYASVELGIPTLTYEIQKGIDPQEVIDTHLEALKESLKIVEKRT